MSDIFISYSRVDKERVRPLVNALEKIGWSVWWDTKIRTGKIFADVIKREIATSKCVLVVWSIKSVESRWVRREVNQGAKRDILAPILIDKVEPPWEFEEYQATDLIGWDGDPKHPGFEQLVRDIIDLIGAPPKPEPDILPFPTPPVPHAKTDSRIETSDNFVFPSDVQERADDAWRDMYQRDEVDGEKRPKPNETGSQYWARQGEFWFDYVANRGDDDDSTYSLAYLCFNRLWIREHWQIRPDEVETRVYLDQELANNQQGLMALPRGEFLAVGWYTVPFLSFLVDLQARFQVPFDRAYQDLEEDLKAAGKRIDNEEARNTERNRRPLFGIPGNRGNKTPDSFRKQFFVPLKTQSENGPNKDLTAVSGFKRYQKTVYVALRLPFNWMFWGLQLDWGGMEITERDAFLGVNGGQAPEKLIVATGPPAVAFGKHTEEYEEPSRAFYGLKMSRPFLPESADEKSPMLMPNQLRLDISSEVHQYARYWGPSKATTQNRGSKKFKPDAPNYASVVAGLGDAFPDPSMTNAGEIEAQSLYPPEHTSRISTAPKLFNPLKVAKTPAVLLAGAAIAVICVYATIANRSSSKAIHNFSPFNLLGIFRSERYEPLVGSESGTKAIQATVYWVPGLSTDPDCQGISEIVKPVFFWGKCRVDWPADYALGFWLLLFSYSSIILALALTARTYRAGAIREEVKPMAETQRGLNTHKPTDERFNNSKHIGKVNRTIWGFTIWTTLVAVVGVLLILPYRPFNTPFGDSLLVVLTLGWFAASLFSGLRHSQWLLAQGKLRRIRQREWLIVWVLAGTALTSVFAGLLLFGKTNVPAYLVFDILFVTTVNATLIGLIFLAVLKGGASLRGYSKSGMVLIGFWHALLQLGVAWLYIIKGNWLTVALLLIGVLVFSQVGKRLMWTNRRQALLFAWLVLGGVTLALPPLVYKVLMKYPVPPDVLRTIFWPNSVDSSLSFSLYEWWAPVSGWWRLIPIALAAVLGGFLSCVWLGWYLAVSLSFNGHIREAGRIAKVQKFKQFIRFRLRENDLTGYVIAVDEPKRSGRDLTPKLIDVFHLKKDKKNPA